MTTLRRNSTGANRERNLSSLCFLLFNSDRDIVPPYVDNRPMLLAGKSELREYKAVFVVADKAVSQFSDEITVNCAPLE
jgi:hypothetical protein